MNNRSKVLRVAGWSNLMGSIALFSACNGGMSAPGTSAAGKSVSAISAPPGPTVCSDQMAAEAAFVSYLFSHNHSTVGADAAVVFVEFPGGLDPAPEFFDRIEDIPTPTAPASKAETDEAGTLRDPATGGRALMIRITSSRLLGPGQAEIRGGYYEAALSASHATYQMRCADGLWKVTATGPLKISQAMQSRGPHWAEIKWVRGGYPALSSVTGVTVST